MAGLKSCCLIVLAALLFSIQRGSTCAIFAYPLLRYKIWPAPSSRARVIAGQLGIVSQDWPAPDLIVAYRYLAGQPLTKSEQASFLRQPSLNKSTYDWSSVERLRKAMERVLMTNLEPFGSDRQLTLAPLVSIQNCPLSTFESAEVTLAARIRQFGEKHVAVHRWAAAQQVVLRNCTSGRARPEEPEADLPELFRFDREYQIAAALFYGTQYEEARSRFQAIAANRASPWNDLADLLVARTYLRQATTFADPFDEGLLRDGDEHLRHILENPDRRAVHTAARRLMNFVAVRLRPAERGAELERELMVPDASPDFGQNVVDYVWLTRARYDASAPQSRAKFSSSSELAKWLYAMSQQHFWIGERLTWEKGATLPALLAGAWSLPSEPDGRQAWELAAAGVRSGPAFPTLVIGRAMRQMRDQRHDDARRLLDQMLARRQVPAEEENVFREARLRLARNGAEFLRFAPRRVAGVMFDQNHYGTELSTEILDQDATDILNRGLPLRTLLQMAQRNQWPKGIREDLWRCVWTRAFAMDRPQELRQAMPEVLKMVPGLTPYANEFAIAPTPVAQRYALTRFLLRRGGTVLLPHLYTNAQDQLLWPEPRTGQSNEDVPFRPAGFLSAAERQEWQREVTAIQSINLGMDTLGGIVLAYARAHPEDVRIPEDLHQIVNLSRGGGAGQISRAAFRLLHQLYPGSPWTARTKYWYR